VNVGCDETFDLGQGRSKAECDQKGADRVYLEFLLKIYADLKARGATMQFWGDIVLQHPELISELPHDVIALNWGYEAGHPFDREAGQFEVAGIPFYVCPGTSSWSSLAGRTDNALANLLNAAEHGRKHGAIGYLNTDWGDNGHWQVLPVSFLGYAAGAAYAWALEANRSLDLPRALNRHAFHDEAAEMGFVAYRLGNLYQDCAIRWQHSSVLSWILQQPLEKVRTKEIIRSIPFRYILEQIDEVDRRLSLAQLVDYGNSLTEPGLIRKEFALAIHMLRHACWRGMLATQNGGDAAAPATLPELDHDLQALMMDYREIWLQRNRPGGLEDSAARFEKARKDYDRNRSFS
jgi:hypothetical protein